jgi:hypothetical protein
MESVEARKAVTENLETAARIFSRPMADLVDTIAHYLRGLHGNFKEITLASVLETKMPKSMRDEPLGPLGYDCLEPAIMKGRKFCLAGDKFMGLVPEHTQPGEAVTIMLGASTPYIIREYGLGQSSRLVGECYMHGMMDGGLTMYLLERIDLE